MKLTSRGVYAIQAVLDMIKNSQGKAVKLQDIAQRQGLSLYYLEQLFRKLRQSGVVRSVRGPGGGYILSKNADATTVSEVLAGVKEVLDYSVKVKLSAQPTEEALAMSKLATDLSNSVRTHLDTKLCDLVK